MVVAQDLQYTTGPSHLADDPRNPGVISGTLKYNGCVFSPLFETKLSGRCVEDNAKRTIKEMEYTVSVDGYVTLPPGATTIGTAAATLHALLTAQNGTLVYKGRALDIVNGTDLSWGPVPKLLEFQPLGAGCSAKVSWQVTVRVQPGYGSASRTLKVGGGAASSLGIMQLNYETSLRYGEDGYSSFTIKGTLEIPLARTTANQRTVDTTVDAYRGYLEKRIFTGIDLGRYHITSRSFQVSRDKRVMEWELSADEKPYMDLPRYCTMARGSFSARPAKTGPGLVRWVCSLRATYTVAAGQRRDWAEIAFFNLLFLRMQRTAVTPSPLGVDANQPPSKVPGKVLSRKSFLIDFSVDEGLYLDSKTVTFSASWSLICSFSQILLASGLWRKVSEGDSGKVSDRRQSHNLWARSMTTARAPSKDAPSASIMGAYSWLPNVLDPKLDVIVDLGSTEV